MWHLVFSAHTIHAVRACCHCLDRVGWECCSAVSKICSRSEVSATRLCAWLQTWWPGQARAPTCTLASPCLFLQQTLTARSRACHVEATRLEARPSRPAPDGRRLSTHAPGAPMQHGVGCDEGASPEQEQQRPAKELRSSAQSCWGLLGPASAGGHAVAVQGFFRSVSKQERMLACGGGPPCIGPRPPCCISICCWAARDRSEGCTPSGGMLTGPGPPGAPDGIWLYIAIGGCCCMGRSPAPPRPCGCWGPGMPPSCPR